MIITPFTFLIAIYSGYRHWAMRCSICIAHSSQPSFHQSGSRIHYFPNHCNGFNFNFGILKVKQRSNTTGFGLTDWLTDEPTKQPTNQLHAIKVLPGKLRVPQLPKKSPVFHRTQRFITMFTTVHHLSLS